MPPIPFFSLLFLSLRLRQRDVSSGVGRGSIAVALCVVSCGIYISSGVGRGSMSCGGPETITNYYYEHNVITLVRRNPKNTSISFYVPIVSGPCRLCHSFLCACDSSMFPQAMAEDLSQSRYASSLLRHLYFLRRGSRIYVVRRARNYSQLLLRT